jgi:HSP20 family protein
MFATRWDPWTRPSWTALNQLHDEVNRLFNRWEGDGRSDVAAFPPVNLYEDENGYVLEAEVPGLEPADLEITVTGPSQLKLKGERKAVLPEKAVPHRQERPFGSFVRTLTLPAPVDADKIEAKFEHGVLRISLPKHEQAKPRRIAVKSS